MFEHRVFYPPRLLRYETELIITPEKYLCAAHARTQVLSSKRGDRLCRIIYVRKSPLSVDLWKKLHFLDAPGRDDGEVPPIRVDRRIVGIPAGTHVKCRYLIVGLIGKNVCRRSHFPL